MRAPGGLIWANLKPPSSGMDMCLSYGRRLDGHDSDSALGRSTELPAVLQQRLTCKLDAEVLVCARPSTVPSPGPAPEIQSPTKQRLGWL